MLAKSWEVAPDGVTWTFHLRKGAQFSDGHPMTAEDVLFNFQLAYDEKLHPSVQDLLKIDDKPFEVSAPDLYTVVVKTSAPIATLVDVVSTIHIVPKHILEPVYKSGNFASAYGVSTPPDKLVTSGPACDSVRARRENGAWPQSVLVRRRSAEPSAAVSE